MKTSSSNISFVIIGIVFAYFLSPRIAVKMIDATPLKTNESFLIALRLFYYPVIQMAKHCPPYIRLIQAEAELIKSPAL